MRTRNTKPRVAPEGNAAIQYGTGSGSDRVVLATLDFRLTLTKPDGCTLVFLVEAAGTDPVAKAPGSVLNDLPKCGAMGKFEFSHSL